MTKRNARNLKGHQVNVDRERERESKKKKKETKDRRLFFFVVKNSFFFLGRQTSEKLRRRLIESTAAPFYDEKVARLISDGPLVSFFAIVLHSRVKTKQNTNVDRHIVGEVAVEFDRNWFEKKNSTTRVKTRSNPNE